jgi:endonuclease-3 related protein
MPSIAQDVFARLFASYGPQHWWPGDSPFEVLLGAMLTQHTSWKNVERALANLRNAGLMSFDALANVSRTELEELLKPAGHYRQKAARIHKTLAYIRERHGSLEAFLEQDLETLRTELLSQNGIGPETADAIALYAAGQPTFVIDAYTQRVFKRHGWIEPEAGYEEMQQFFHSSLERDAPLYNEYHALLVQVGKSHCQKTPVCSGCPLESLLPPGGICQPEW